MIKPELITRLKSCLQYLAESQGEKFEIIVIDDIWDFRLLEKSETEILRKPIITYERYDFDIRPDPFKVFSNSLYRIVWEATNGEMMHIYPDTGDGVKEVHFRNQNTKHAWIWYNYTETEQLSAEIEATCIRIEELRNK